jgi:hypothetical protein
VTGRTCGTYGRDEKVCKILVGNPEGKNHSEDLGVDGKRITMDLREMGEKVWAGCIWLKTDQ